VTVSCERRNGACSFIHVRRAVAQRRHKFLPCFDPNSCLFRRSKCLPAGGSAETRRGVSLDRRPEEFSSSAFIASVRLKRQDCKA